MTTLYKPNTFRPYAAEAVSQLRGSFNIEHTLAKLGSNRLWELLNTQPYIRALSAYTGNQAVQLVKAGIQSVYLSGWQISADNNTSNNVYPDMSLYPVNSMPTAVKRVNGALLNADRIEHLEGDVKRHWLAPILADAESGFGNVLNSFELAKSLIEAGVSAFHWEDQNSAAGKKCGHMAGKCLLPTKTFIKHLTAARLASDVLGVPTVALVARTDAESAGWISSDVDEYDHRFIDFDTRSDDGFYALKGDPMERCVARGLAYAPFSDLVWFETSTPDIGQAREFSQAIHAVYPNKMLAYNNSPSFNWKKNLSDKQIASFQDELGALNYKYLFITLAAWHTNAMSTFELATRYKDEGMKAYVELVQEKEFELQSQGYTAVKHQREVGTGYFDQVRQVIDGNSELSALAQSTENKQF